MAILDVQHIEKHFGDTSVLKDISFSLEEGQALSIIGSSGSGKTTLLRCLNFLETPDQGVISVRGKTLFDAADPDTRRDLRRGLRPGHRGQRRPLQYSFGLPYGGDHRTRHAYDGGAAHIQPYNFPAPYLYAAMQNL